MMLSTGTLAHLHRPASPLRCLFSPSTPPAPVTSQPFLSLSVKPLRLRQIPPRLSFSTTTTASSSHRSSVSAPPEVLLKVDPTTTVEHVVLLKVKPDAEPARVDAMISKLQSLVSLDGISHLTAAPVLCPHSSAASGFTHLLHGRYPTKDDLFAYQAHPAHVSVAEEFVFPICDDIMAFDWVDDLDADAVTPRPGSAARVTLAKLKDGSGEGEKGEVMAALAGVGGASPAVVQVSFGENFSPARAKGYSVGLITVFPGLEELDALNEKGELDEKVRSLLESVIVVDFVIPPPPAASL